jgi:GT2 family glycosyltransferase
VVPTFGREEILVDTVERLFAQLSAGDELLVLDQTPRHTDGVGTSLERLESEGRIRWLRLARPSIPAAMNRGLLESRKDVVAFFDDDIVPGEGLLDAHRSAHGNGLGPLVAGQVLQPGECEEPLENERFRFRSSVSQRVREFMGGNFSIRRRTAIELGGFDERFVGAAYRFEREFAARATAAGIEIWFEARAAIRHLRAERGGTRSYGNHLRTASPAHAVGEYYDLLLRRPPGWSGEVARRLARSSSTRFHLAAPWRIPITLFAEVSGLFWALTLVARGPQRLSSGSGDA